MPVLPPSSSPALAFHAPIFPYSTCCDLWTLLFPCCYYMCYLTSFFMTCNCTSLIPESYLPPLEFSPSSSVLDISSAQTGSPVNNNGTKSLCERRLPTLTDWTSLPRYDLHAAYKLGPLVPSWARLRWHCSSVPGRAKDCQGLICALPTKLGSANLMGLSAAPSMLSQAQRSACCCICQLQSLVT